MTTATPHRPDTGRAQDHATGRARSPWIALALLLATVAVLLVVEAAGVVPDGAVLRGPAAAAAALAVVLLGLGLLVHGLRASPSSGYADTGSRDLRIDMLRGVAIVFVVLDHIDLPSLFQLPSQEAVGIVSGAELFVAVSGVIVGMVYGGRLVRTDLVTVTGALWTRAWKLYRTALVVVVVVYLLTLLPGVDGRAVTTFDAGNGQVSDTYPNVARLADYPVPGFLVRDLLRLQLGPRQFNIMGLFVVLLLVSPLLLAALRRRLGLLVLLASWGLYALNAASPTRVLPSQFEDPFPLLTWQVLFVTGVVVGWYRTALLVWFRRPLGRAVLVAAVVAHLAVVLLAWSSGFLSNGYDVRLALLPVHTFDALHAQWFTRTTLDLGRLLDTWLLLGTLYALLTAYWSVLDRALGWFFVPLGRASLYVFVLHVPAALVVANLPGLGGDSVALGTLAHGIVLAVLWTMVRRRVLFRVIPH